uniref:Period circadian protein n=1 Tax=Dendroctonus ponderosae TaxID=77166 RepID=A0AAR5PRM2_DENPD
MESESGTNNTKISDSGYSNSCSNTTSQGSASSKSRHSGGSNSSRSSGYGGTANPNENNESSHLQAAKPSKEHKKTGQTSSTLPAQTDDLQPVTALSDGITEETSSARTSLGVESTPYLSDVDLSIQENVDFGSKKPEPILDDDMHDTQDEKETTTIHEDQGFLDSSADHVEPVAQTVENQIVEFFPKADLLASGQCEVNDGFCCVISMHDGLVLYTTPSITSILGFPEDTWLGHSFIDFVHPKDRDTFSTKVSTSVGLPLIDSNGKDVRNCFYVCLRRHTSSEVPLLEKPISYQAFNLTVTIKQMTESPESGLADHNNCMFLFIIAVPVISAYKVPKERKMSSKFGMRHTASCIISYVDPDVVTNFGFLPQDMLGKSVFDFYHPEDMPFLKEVYKSVMKTCQINGSVFRSKPYRFMVQNGCFALIETEWSSVINPWSKRMECVISLHQVLEGPLNPNVFDLATDIELKAISSHVISQGKVLQAEILQLLTVELPKPVEICKQEVSRRCKNLASFVESFISTTKLEIEVPQEFNESFSERDSVMLGEISPHHDFCDSKSSSETPPSYNQLNYNENITRFFQSNPNTSATYGENQFASNAIELIYRKKEDEVSDCVPINPKCLSPLQNCENSRYGSAGNLSSGSTPNLESEITSGTNMTSDDYKAPQLTASVLVRHNEDMEKIMIQKHKKERSHFKDREAKKSHQKLEKHTNEMFMESANEHHQGVKRSGRHLIEDREGCKIFKQNGHNELFENPGPSFYSNAQMSSSAESPSHPHRSDLLTNALNMWSPFPVPVAHNAKVALNQGVLPVYYVPTIVPPGPQVSQRNQVQYLPAGVLSNYAPGIFPPPILCPTIPILSLQNVPLGPEAGHLRNIDPTYDRAAYLDSRLHPSDGSQQFDAGIQRLSGSGPQCYRPSSQATSVKAEPGSRIGSIASASVVNKLPEPILRPNKLVSSYRPNRMEEESSCYSSSYSSFLKTDTGSRSNDDSASCNNTNRTDDEMVNSQRQVCPLRKREPPWLESMTLTPDVIYRYQMSVKNIDDILKMDLNALKQIEQPVMVNDQLQQLYIEMELEGLSKALTLEEERLSSSSSSSGDILENNAGATNLNRKRPYSSFW